MAAPAHTPRLDAGVSVPQDLRRIAILPAHNEEDSVAGVIDEIRQADPEFQIVVVDDGSEDRTSEVVREKFSHEARVRLFTEKNKGKAVALNTGLSHANGEIIVALDADTVFAPQTLSLIHI